MNVSISTFDRAQIATRDALASIQDAAKLWLAAAITRQALVKLSLGDGEKTNDKITVKVEIPNVYLSPTNLSPSILLTDDLINQARNLAQTDICDEISGNTGVKVTREMHNNSFGARNNSSTLNFTVVIDTSPF
jgi:hypothetical protein